MGSKTATATKETAAKDSTKPTEAESTALVKTEYAGLQDFNQVKEALRDNFGADGLKVTDLQTVRVPTGGGTAFNIASLEGDTTQKETAGIIVFQHSARSFWEKSFDESGGGSPPDCSSPDGVTGYGNPGGKCAECAMNQFGSGRNGSKACKEFAMLYQLRKDEFLPVVVVAPPSSLGSIRKYRGALTTKGISLQHVVSRVGLEPAQNKQGIKYSRVKFGPIEKVSAEEKALANAYRKEIEAVVQRPEYRERVRNMTTGSESE
jgi:hypothetical protein